MESWATIFIDEATKTLLKAAALLVGAALLYLPCLLFGAGYNAICALMGA